MTTTVLARKWRPKKFADLVGQTTVTTVLKNIISSNRLHHAYLLTGTRGVGKTTIARIIAKSLNCENRQGYEPCCVCKSCIDIDQGRAIDIIEIDAASNTGVDNIREVLDNAQYAPSYTKYKIFIIDEVHMLSKSAFNAMLKTLEEPPSHVCFILATTDPQKVPITILSRCLQLKLRNMTQSEITNHLHYILEEEHIPAEDTALTLLASNANGSMRDALSLTDQAIAYSDSNITTNTIEDMLGIASDTAIINLLQYIIDSDKSSAILQLSNLYEQGIELGNIFQQLRLICYELSANIELKVELQLLQHKINPNTLQVYFEIISIALNQLKITNNDYPVAAMAILRMINFSLANEQTIAHIVHNLEHNVATTITQPTLKAAETNPAVRVTTPSPSIPTTQTVVTKQAGVITPLQLSATITNDDWIALVKDNKHKLDAIIVPILENSTLQQFANNKLEINIEAKYQDLLQNTEISTKITQRISKIIAIDNIEIIYHYVDKLDGTIKQEVTRAKEVLLDNAKQEFYNDHNVSTLINSGNFTVIDKSIINTDNKIG